MQFVSQDSIGVNGVLRRKGKFMGAGSWRGVTRRQTTREWSACPSRVPDFRLPIEDNASKLVVPEYFRAAPSPSGQACQTKSFVAQDTLLVHKHVIATLKGALFFG